MHFSATPASKTQPTEVSWAMQDDQLNPMGHTTLTGKSSVCLSSCFSPRSSVQLRMSSSFKPRLGNSPTRTGAWPNHSCKAFGTFKLSKKVLASLFDKSSFSPGRTSKSRNELGFAKRCGAGGTAAMLDKAEPSQIFRCLPSADLGAATTLARPLTVCRSRSLPRCSSRTVRPRYSSRS